MNVIICFLSASYNVSLHFIQFCGLSPPDKCPSTISMSQACLINIQLMPPMYPYLQVTVSV